MGIYNGKIIRVEDDFDNNDFPEQFANEIYLSKVNSDFHYRYHSPFSIKYVFDGCDNYEVEGKAHQVKGGQVLIINNGAEVVCEKTGQQKVKSKTGIGMSVFLDREVINDVFAAMGGMKEIPEMDSSIKEEPLFYDDIIRDDQSLKNFLGSLFTKYYFSEKEDIPVETYYDIASHLLHFQYRFFEKIEPINKVKYSTRKEIFSRVSIAKEYLDGSYMIKFNLDILARQCAMSKYLLIHSFKTIHGKTPQQYFIELRINKAKELLKKEKRVAEVARQLGYPDIHCFSKQFKLATGFSPLQFKELSC